MPKKSTKVFKIIAGVIIFFTLPSLLFFGFLYFKYNEDLPTGVQGETADQLAHNMLEALNYEAYKNTDHIEWTFKKRHHYKWDKKNNICEVYWKSYRVVLDLNNKENTKVYIQGFINQSELAPELIETATNYFNNDSFWLVAPYKVFDKGVERRLVKTTNNDALLVTYTSGGSTPGDSYLWLMDDDYKPVAFKMWTSILPIDGLEASWNRWKTTETGAQLPEFHKMLFLGLEITDIKGYN
ncbi:hypothetical protein JJL45_11410 [Tamlana sp. s12]|uniref:Uncharacterized protein n=1 Tax=Pseudotamlana haliotis TaxID=2614804 RepID=A0A6N6MPD4_9FLAO|nr:MULTISPECIES: hypothetical protein [Tamlana]KAB1070345.1 hypothetical protein F6U93_01980 [Tamlana haliotis]OBQ51785.1 hypothetical protein VQ01_15015 [Tamlana sp. s12]QQY81532.1 hypothetical protein JJL45_11410 [Tamlana sp. s12]